MLNNTRIATLATLKARINAAMMLLNDLVAVESRGLFDAGESISSEVQQQLNDVETLATSLNSSYMEVSRKVRSSSDAMYKSDPLKSVGRYDSKTGLVSGPPIDA